MPSQADFLQAMDGAIVAGFAAIGMADTATYTPAGGGGSITVQVMVDRTVVDNGFETVLAGDQVRLSFLVSEVGAGAPDRDALVLLGADTFTVDKVVARDEGIVQVLARKSS